MVIKFSFSFILELAPTVVTYYGNRSAAYMMIGNYDKALEDAQTAIRTDENFMKVGQDPQNIFLISQ